MLWVVLPPHVVPMNAEYRCVRLMHAGILKARMILLYSHF